LYENTGNTYLYNEGLVEFIPQPNAYGEDTEIHMVLKSDHTTRYNIYFNFTKATDPNSADFEPHDVTTSYCQYLAWQGSTLRRTLREPGYWYYYKAAFYNGISFEGQTEGIYYCNVTVGVEDGIYFEPLLSSYQTNTYYYSGSAYYRNFIDQAPQGDYIVSWDNWKCYANNGYEDVLIMDSQSFNIPTLPDGFNWERDSNGNVIATMTTGGIDNDGHHHTSSREIKISGVPNNFVTSGTIPVNTTWCGDITITGDIIVPVGKQLTVLLNTHITFTNGSSLIVEGNLVFENHDFRMSVLDFQSQNATLKNGIKVNAGGTANINNAVVKNAYNGVYVDEGVVNIDNSEIFDCYYGIHLYRTNYVSYPDSYIENTHSHDNEFGVVMYYSTAHLSNNEFNNNWRGVGCADYSSPFLAPNDNNSESNGYNYIHNNDIGVFAYGYSNPFLGRETCVSFGGNNTIVNNNDYEFFTHSNCNVSAENNYWGGGAPVRYVGSGCSFDYTPYLTSAPQQSQSTVASPEEEVFDIQFESQLSKANNSADVVSLSKSSITSGFNKSWSIEWKLLYARNLMRVKKYNEAATICEDVITNYPDSSFSYLALDLLHQSRIKSRSKSLFLQFVEEKAKLKTEKQIYGLAELLLVVGEKENRVSILNGIMDKYKDTPLVEFVLFQKFMYYLYEENNLELAKTTSETLGKLFPNSESYYDSRRQLGEDVGIHLQPQLTKNTPNEETVELPKTYELHGNYPNPFNPSTTISYSLAFNSNVEITIFEITGKVVKVFSENVQSAGYRNIVWNGNNQQGAKVSSGIYFYRFKAISLENEAVFEKTAKMLLLK
ncbi:MAG: T9SS type A sorting domain-containing protein, partial [Bacteroidetes bacterium]|nr:T9SS type A sorting domain-containing protein [Bacteroidota bacterium]